MQQYLSFVCNQTGKEKYPWIYYIVINLHKKKCSCKESQSSIFSTFHFWCNCSSPLGGKSANTKRRRPIERSIFPPTDEKVNRFYLGPQLGLPFPPLLTCTWDGWLLQESRWRRTNTNTGIWKTGGLEPEKGLVKLRRCAATAPNCPPGCEERLEKSSAGQEHKAC